MPTFEENDRDPRVLADRAVAFRAHTAVGEDLRDGILRSDTLLALVGGAKRLDVVERVIVADVLESIGNALDEVFLLDSGHFRLSVVGGSGSPRLRVSVQCRAP
jgi:hypothetical protein